MFVKCDSELLQVNKTQEQRHNTNFLAPRMITPGESKILLNSNSTLRGERNPTHCMIDLFKCVSILQGEAVAGGIEWNSRRGCRDISW